MNATWVQTLDSAPVSNWLDDIRFPYESAEKMIEYLKSKQDPSLSNMIQMNNEMPQSFAHWWCYLREQHHQRVIGEPLYPRLEHWRPIVFKWRQEHATSVDVIATFVLWMDLLLVDLVTYDDEDQRPNVPRKTNHGIVWNTTSQEIGTRKETMTFLMDEARACMQERGFKEGETYWNEKCKQYLIF